MNLPALPNTVYSLYYEAEPEGDDDEGFVEFVDAPGYTADQMRAYASAAAEAAQADAKRYRWLRDCDSIGAGCVRRSVERLLPGEWDKSIDEAMRRGDDV